MVSIAPIVPGNDNGYKKNNGAKIAIAIILLFGFLIFFIGFMNFNIFNTGYGMHPWFILSITFFIFVIIIISLIATIAASMSKKYEANSKVSVKGKNFMDLSSNYHQVNKEIQKVNPYVKKPNEGYKIQPFGNIKQNNLTIVSHVHYCMYCGSKVDNNAVYCHQCGIKLESK